MPESAPQTRKSIVQSLGLFMNRFSAINPASELTEAQRQRAKEIANARKAAALSTGPTSPEGKRISAQNARKHGFAGSTMAVTDDERPLYEAHVETYMEAYGPRNQPEADAVRFAANAAWRLQRLADIEASLLELELTFRTPHIDATLNGTAERHRLAIAFVEHVDQSQALDLCRRYAASALRDFSRATDLLKALQAVTKAVPTGDEAPANPVIPPVIQSGPPATPDPRPRLVSPQTSPSPGTPNEPPKMPPQSVPPSSIHVRHIRQSHRNGGKNRS